MAPSNVVRCSSVTFIAIGLEIEDDLPFMVVEGSDGRSLSTRFVNRAARA